MPVLIFPLQFLIKILYYNKTHSWTKLQTVLPPHVSLKVGSHKSNTYEASVGSL